MGGSFTTVGGVAAASVARWTGSTWIPLSMDLAPSGPFGAFRGPAVLGLALDGGRLFAGGMFSPDGMPLSGGVAEWTGTEWEILGSGLAQHGGLAGDLAAVVGGVAVHDGMLHAAGCFTRTGGDAAGATELPGVARWTGTAWEPLPGGTDNGVASAWFHSLVCGSEPSGTAMMETDIQRIHSDGTRLYVAGTFAGIDGVASKGIVAHDGEGWVPQGDTTGAGLAGAPEELVVGDPECRPYVFRGVSHAGDTIGALVYRYEEGEWAAVASSGPGEGLSCWQLAVASDGTVYLGCDGPGDLDGPGAPRIYRLEGSEWIALGEITDVTGTVAVGDMVIDAGDRLWIVGGSGLEGFVLRWDGAGFTRVGAFDGTVTEIAIAPDGRRVVVGGVFTGVDSIDASGVAHFDGEAWEPLGAGLPSPMDTPVAALAYGTDAIYVSTHSGYGAERMVLGRWDGTRWEDIAVPGRGLPAPVGPSEHQFYGLWAHDGHLVAVGGVFPETGARNAFVFDGESFEPLGGGVGAISVDALAVTPDALWLGGTIATTGSGDTLAPSVGVARYVLGDG